MTANKLIDIYLDRLATRRTGCRVRNATNFSPRSARTSRPRSPRARTAARRRSELSLTAWETRRRSSKRRATPALRRSPAPPRNTRTTSP